MCIANLAHKFESVEVRKEVIHHQQVERGLFGEGGEAGPCILFPGDQKASSLVLRKEMLGDGHISGVVIDKEELDRRGGFHGKDQYRIFPGESQSML